MLACIFILMNAILFLTALHNSIRYLYGLKIKRMLIILYYAFTLPTGLFKCAVMVLSIIHPPHYYDPKYLETLQLWTVLASTAIVLSLCSGTLVLLTMQQLTTTIQLFFGHIDAKQADFKEKAGYATAIILVINLIASQYFIFLSFIARFVIIMFDFLLITISYTYSFCVLSRLLDKFKDQTFEKEIASIRVQSWGFYIGSFLYLSFFIIEFTLPVLNGLYFGVIVTAVALEEFSYFIPTMYFMAVHHRIFKEAI